MAPLMKSVGLKTKLHKEPSTFSSTLKNFKKESVKRNAWPIQSAHKPFLEIQTGQKNLNRAQSEYDSQSSF
jgi:hypothetical protein